MTAESNYDVAATIDPAAEAEDAQLDAVEASLYPDQLHTSEIEPQAGDKW